MTAPTAVLTGLRPVEPDAAPTKGRGRPLGTRAWTVDAPPPHITEFVNWYVYDRDPTWGVMAGAKALGMSHVTFNRRLQDDRVLLLLERELRRSNAGPVRVQNVLDMLYRRAVEQEDVKAAGLYLQAVDRLAPRRVEVTHHDARDLSNEQLAAELHRALGLLNAGPIMDAEVIEDDEPSIGELSPVESLTVSDLSEGDSDGNRGEEGSG